MFSSRTTLFSTILSITILAQTAAMSIDHPKTDKGMQKLTYNRGKNGTSFLYKRKSTHTFNGPLNYVKGSDSLNDSPDKIAAAYDAIPCPTDKCSCTRDTDKNPPLKQINCRYKELSSVPVFRQVDLIYDELTFGEGNNIKRIPFAAFYYLKVRHINLLNNDLAEVADGAFVGLEDVLEKLELQGNGIGSIPYNKLSNLKNLKELRLVNFGDDRIKYNNKFESFEKLEVLEFRNMKNLFTVDVNAFTNKLQMLHTIVFDDVKFTEIPVNSLQQLKSIRKLTISRSQIRRVYAESFTGGNLHNLDELTLSNNQIYVLDDRAFDKVCLSLFVLDLTINNLSNLTALRIKNWPKLEDLNLSNNPSINSLSDSVFQNMPNLVYLNLMTINLQIISQTTFAGLSSLHTLVLSYNKIEYIQERSFIHSQHLKELRIGYQNYGKSVAKISQLDLSPSVLEGITTSLTRLDVSYTLMKGDSFWKSVKELSNLEELIASRAGLTNIPENTFRKSSHLQYIVLENNAIKELSNTVFIGLEKSLRTLNLRSNKLVTVDQCVFKNFNLSDFEVDLAGNSLHCDCKLNWLHDLITIKINQAPFYFSDTTCETPVQLKGIFLKDISRDSLSCPDNIDHTCVYIPETTTATTTTRRIVTTQPISSTGITTKPTPTPASLTLHVGASTKSTLTLYWGVLGNVGAIHSFKIEYHAAIDNLVTAVSVKPGTKEYTVTGLKPGLLYKICVSVETVTGRAGVLKECKSRETLTEEAHSQGFKEKSNQNIVIVILVTSVIVVVLIISGMYMLVKYKIQKLREMRLTLTSPGLPRRDDPSWDMCSREDSSSCPNEYVTIQNTKQLKETYKIYSDMELRRQHARENKYTDRYYSTYRKHKKYRNKDENETDDKHHEENNEKIVYKDESQQQKSELESRHSAPSRLNANDLMKSGKDRNSRPLPATPNETARQAKDDKEETNAKTRNVFMTQASVYEPKSPGLISTSEKRDSIYYEIEASDDLPEHH